MNFRHLPWRFVLLLRPAFRRVGVSDQLVMTFQGYCKRQLLECHFGVSTLAQASMAGVFQRRENGPLYL